MIVVELRLEDDAPRVHFWAESEDDLDRLTAWVRSGPRAVRILGDALSEMARRGAT